MYYLTGLSFTFVREIKILVATPQEINTVVKKKLFNISYIVLGYEV